MKKSRFKVTKVSQQEEEAVCLNRENLLKVISTVNDAKDNYGTWDDNINNIKKLNAVPMESSTRTWNEGIRSVNWKKLQISASNIHKSTSLTRLSQLFRRRSSRLYCKYCGHSHSSGKCLVGSLSLLTDAHIPPNQLFPYFLQSHSIYDLMPINSKVVVITTDLKLINAISAIFDNSIRSLFLYDPSKDGLVGILTLTDLLRYYRKVVRDNSYDSSFFENTTIKDFLNDLRGDHVPELLRIEPDMTLFHAVLKLQSCYYHRLPVMTRDNNILYVFTCKRVLRFLYYSTVGKCVPSSMYNSMEQIGVGNFKELVTVNVNQPLTDVMEILENTKISAVPITDDRNYLIGQLSKLDILILSMKLPVFFPDKISAVGAFDIVKKIEPRRLITCKRTDTFINVWEKMLQLQASRAFFLNEQRKLIGVVSVCDIVNYLTFGGP